MSYDDLIKNWEEDSKINKLDISGAILNISELHFKWQRILMEENLRLSAAKADYNKLYLDKYIFYTEGAKNVKDKEMIKRLPKGAILKSEAETYIQADEDIISLSRGISMISEKIKFIESALWELRGRSKNLQNYVNWEKFQAGL